MEHLEELYEMCEFVNTAIKEANDKIKKAGGKLNAGDVEYLDKLSHTLKSLKSSIMLIENEDEYSERGYSREGNSNARGGRGGYSRDGSYESGNSYARGRGSRAKRDAMGRYSSDNYGGYSRADAKDDMMSELRELMQDADPSMRGEFQAFISKLERM